MAHDAYVKTNWQTGDVVSAEKLNKIETELEYVDTAIGSMQSDILSIGATPPNNGKLLWLDTSTEHGTGVRYYKGTGDITDWNNWNPLPTFWV